MSTSKATIKVLRAFLDRPSGDQYGFGLMRSTGVKSGSLYPILEKLQHLGWIESHAEDIDETVVGRPRRRLYRLTGLGESEGQKAVADFYRDLGPAPTWLPRLEPA